MLVAAVHGVIGADDLFRIGAFAAVALPVPVFALPNRAHPLNIPRAPGKIGPVSLKALLRARPYRRL